MRTTFDFSPLFRSGVGFDRMLNALEAASHVETVDNWPPYDIARTGEDDYRITMAVAGFRQDELSIIQEQSMLMVSGQKAGGDEASYLHRGIAAHTFQRRFELADHVKVVGASLANGLLTIDLKREIPEEMKPRKPHEGGTMGQAQFSYRRKAHASAEALSAALARGRPKKGERGSPMPNPG